MTTLADEVPARYREWVEHNRAWVHEQSAGRVGYLHLPDMMADGFAEFHRYFGAECDRDALIVDLRYNRGGHVSELLLEKVARKRIAYNVPRWGRTVSYPEESAAGPVVALCNEHAGSDGDIFAHGFKLMGIGPLVGTRTWGGVIGIWPRTLLVDGTETTQPEYSFWFRDVGWGVENHGTDPNIEVDNAPQDAAAGRDRQLETALATALQLAEGRSAGAAAHGAAPEPGRTAAAAAAGLRPARPRQRRAMPGSLAPCCARVSRWDCWAPARCWPSDGREGLWCFLLATELPAPPSRWVRSYKLRREAAGAGPMRGALAGGLRGRWR